MLTKEEKKQTIEKWHKHEKDVGSAALQVALLSIEIQKLTDHFKTHTHDNAGKRGLFLKLARRKKLLGYLARHNRELHQKVVADLHL